MVLHPVVKLVAVNVNMPEAVDVPGLLTGLGGAVGANQPNAIPAVELPFTVTVDPLQNNPYVATGATVFDVIVIGTVAVQELIVFVTTHEYVPGVITLKLVVFVCVQTAVVLLH